IKPDLTCLGKIIGGGFPVGAYGGRREIMDLVAPVGPVYQAGTLSGNPVAMTAGLETLKILKKPETYGRLDTLAQLLADGFKNAAENAGVPVFQTRVGSMLGLFFTQASVSDFDSAKTADVERYARFFHEMLEKGVYFAPSQFEAAFLSLAHDETLVQETISAATEVFKRL
ncbi:MAG: aminotransferase class III-fold pyridoxal phosphate-dependent enzyme, partial [Calditrichaeota bacterium]